MIKFVGLAYRWSAAMSAMVGFQVSEGMYIGYGYDHDTTRLKITILVPMKYFCVMKYLKIMVKSQLKFF
jgi:hypothetical protein